MYRSTIQYSETIQYRVRDGANRCEIEFEMKWAGIMASVVVTIGLIIAVGFLITYLHPANNTIQKMDDDDDDHDDWRGKQGEAGEVGGGAGRGGEDVGKFKKQEVKNENHGALEVHLFELNEETEGGKTEKSGLGETLIVTMLVIGSITAFCTISACAAILWKCGLCPERRRRRRRSSRSSSGGSGRKRTHSEDIELGELRLKMRKLEKKAAREEEEQEKKEQELEKVKEKQETKEKELEKDVEEAPRAGLRAITTEVGCVPELDELETVSMEEYSRRLEKATKTLREIESARRVLDHHQDNIRRGATLGYIAGVGGAGGAGGR